MQPEILLASVANLVEVKMSFEAPHWKRDSRGDRALPSRYPFEVAYGFSSQYEDRSKEICTHYFAGLDRRVVDF
jgi:hypothetical protein